MTYEEQLYRTPPGGFKKRRLQNSCDSCKKKKIRCDSAKMPGNICSNCIYYNAPCTHRLAEARIAMNKKQSDHKSTEPMYVFYHHPGPGDTQRRLALRTDTPDWSNRETARSYVTAILDSATPFTVPEDPSLVQNILFQIAAYARDLEDQLPSTSKPVALSRDIDGSDNTSDQETNEDPARALSDLLSPVDIGEDGEIKRSYLGKSSTLMLLGSALLAKDGLSEPAEVDNRRLEFWSVHPWQLDPLYQEQTSYVFPEHDLLWQLIKNYFERFCASIRVVHRPSFEKAVLTGKHLHDQCFGALLLSVCGLGSRFSSDPRVFDEGCTSEQNAGWKFMRQIRPFTVVAGNSTKPPSVYELQMICNYILFTLFTSHGDVAWFLLGVGIRYAQGAGAHRKGFLGSKPTVENENWKRAFWTLIVTDCYMSAYYGRPRATTPLDYDQDLPLEVDDEYWEPSDPDQEPFTQPAGQPSKTTFWVQFVKLIAILGNAQRSILALEGNGSKEHIWGVPNDEKVILQLDTELNGWLDAVPDHLRWCPDKPFANEIFFNQSATLYSVYYWVTIQIHRPFIPRVSKVNSKSAVNNSPLSYSSLAVCTNAARACARLLDVQLTRGLPDVPTAQFSAFSSAMILVLNLWGGSRLGLTADPSQQLEDVYKCLRALKSFENRWQISGKVHDIITMILDVSQIPQRAPTISRKRSRTRFEDDCEQEGNSYPTPSSVSASSSSSVLFGSSKSASPAADVANHDYLKELPLYPHDLGRMPVHPQPPQPPVRLPQPPPHLPPTPRHPPTYSQPSQPQPQHYAPPSATQQHLSQQQQQPYVVPAVLSYDGQQWVAPETHEGPSYSVVHGVPYDLPQDQAWWSNAPESVRWDDWVPYAAERSRSTRG
ncbi:Gypsy retrotransposon integrase-like protein 1 [Marasmius sp. AFHP31]|nr:Gypsy retrotransposon integrase-like protein 1 [Marasmius sp. AFHP31]